MASRFERELKLLFSFVKDRNKYDIPKISAELEAFQTQLQGLGKFLNQKFSVRIEGVSSVIQLKNALVSLNRTLPGVNTQLDRFANTAKIFDSINSGNVVGLKTAIEQLSAAFSKFTVKGLDNQFSSLVKVMEDLSDIVKVSIKPLNDFENAVGSLDTKIQQSIRNLQSYTQIFQALNQISSGISTSLAGTKTPVFKSKETELATLIGQYTKLSDVIDRSKVSLEKFNKTPIGKTDAGTQKQVADTAKAVQKSYEQLKDVVARLDFEFKTLSADQNANKNTLASLKSAIDAANIASQKRLQILNSSLDASRKLENQERKLRDEYNNQFNSIGGIIKRQIEFVAGASIIATTFGTIRKGFDTFNDTLTQVGRVLTVSRSNFLNVSQTAEILRDTIGDFASKTGSSIQDVSTVLKEFGSAGLTTEQSIAALNSTLNNIIGTDSSVVETTRLVASSFNILGNTITGSNDQIKTFTRINDIFARATNESSLELDQLVQALKFSLPASKEAGTSLEELTALLGQLADQGIRGGNAGRALRAALQQISKDADRLAKALNIQIDLTKPLDLLDIIRQYGQQIKGQEISVEELGTIFERFGLRGADVFLLLAQNIDKVDAKIKDLNVNSKNAAAIAAQLRLDAPERQFARFANNIGQLSSKVFEPVFALFLKLVTVLNDFAEKIRLLDSPLLKFAAQLTGVYLAVLALVNALSLLAPLLKSVAAFFTGIPGIFARITAAVAGSTGVFATLSAIFAELLPVIGLIVIAVGIAAVAFGVFSENAATLKKELEEQIVSIQQTIQETSKLAESYDTLSDRIKKNSENLERGNISQEEYRNELNSIAQTTPQVADIIEIYGNNSALAALKIQELAEAQRLLNLAQKETLKVKEFQKFEVDLQVAEDYIKRLKEIKDLERRREINIRNPQLAEQGLIRTVTEEDLQEAKQKLDEFGKANKEAIRKLIADITATAATSSNEEVIRKAKETISQLKEILGDFATGFGADSNPLKDIVEEGIEAAKRYSATIKSLTFDITELANFTSDATLGLKGLRSEFLFKFKVVIPKEDLDKVKRELEGLPAQLNKDLVGKNFINSLNVDGISQLFRERLQKSGFQNIKFETLKENLSKALDVSSNSEQFQIIENTIKKVTDVQIKSASSSKEQLELEKNRDGVLRQINALRNDEIRLYREMIESAKLQGEQEIFNNLEYRLINRALKEARTIRGDILEQAKFEESISFAQLKDVREEVNAARLKLKTEKLTNEEHKRFIKNLGIQVQLESAFAKNSLNRRKIEFEINNTLRESQIVLQNQTSIGGQLIDQDEARLKLIDFEISKLLSEREKFGINYEQLTASINKLEAERAGIYTNQISSLNNILVSAFNLRSQFESLFSIDQKRANIISNIKETQLKILQLNVQLRNSEALGEKAAKNTAELRQKLSSEILKQINNQKDLRELEDQEIKNTKNILDLRKKINDEQTKINEELSSRAEEPLRKLLEQFFEENDFSRTLLFLKSINLSFEDGAFLLGDNNKKVDLFIDALRKGNIDLNRYPQNIREIGKAFQDNEAALVEFRKTQEEINQQKFDLLKESFGKAIELGGQTGRDRAAQIIQEMLGLTEVLDEKGKRNLTATQGRLDQVQEFLSQLSDPELANKNPFLPTEEGAELARNQIDLLTESINNAVDALSKLNAEGRSFEAFANLLRALNSGVVPDNVGGTSPQGFARGGPVPGRGRGDTVPAMLEPGEFIIPRRIVEQQGINFFYGLIGGKPTRKFMNGGLIPRYAEGGAAEGIGNASAKFAVQLDFVTGFTEIIRLTNEANSLTVRYGSATIGALNEIKSNIDSVIVYQKSIYDSIEAIKGFTKDTTFNTSRSLKFLTDIETNTLNLDSYLDAIAEGVNAEFKARKASDPVAQQKESADATPGFARGGPVPGTGRGDVIPAMLEPGEFVIPREIVRKKGLGFFEDLIEDKYHFAKGGIVASLAASSISSFGPQADKVAENNLKELKKNTDALDKLNDILAGKSSSIPKGPDEKDLSALERFRKNREDSTQRRINTGTADQNIKKTNEQLRIGIQFTDRFNRIIGVLTHAWTEYRKQVRAAGVATQNVFLQQSAKSADKFLERLEQIGDLFEDLFTRTIPNMLGFFLSDVVESNIRILADYQKVRRDIAKTYKDQRADLIEQLKRNEISYFDFFDKLEDLQDKQREDEIKAEEEKDKAVREQFSKNIETITELVGGLISNIAGAFGDLAAGLPALIAPLGDAFGAIGSNVGGALGDIFGTAANVVPVVGAVIGAGVKVFSFAAQGFASLLPFVSRFVTLLASGEEDFQDVLTAIAAIPQEFDDAVQNIVANIPTLVNALVNEGGLINIGNAFANAIEIVLPEIASAFVQIIPTALFATIPIVTAIFDTFPDLLASVLLSEGALIGAFVQLFFSAAEEFFDAFEDNIPRIIELIGDAFLVALTNISQSDLGSGIAQALTQGIENSFPQIIQSISEVTSNISGALLQSSPQFLQGLQQAIPALTQALSNTVLQVFQNSQGTLETALNSFLDLIIQLIPKAFTELPIIIEKALNQLSSVGTFQNSFAQLFSILFTSILNKIPEIVLAFFTGLAQTIPQVAASFIRAAIDALKANDGLFDIIKNFFKNFDTKEILLEISNILTNIIPFLIKTFVDSFSENLTPQLLTELVIVFLSHMADSFNTLSGGIFDQFFTNFFAFFEELRPKLEAFFQALNTFHEVVGDLANVIYQLLGETLLTFIQIFSDPSMQAIFARINILFTKFIQKISSAISLFSGIFLTTLTRVINRISDIIRDITESLKNSDVFDLFIEILITFFDTLILISEVLDPIVTELMPALEILLTILAYTIIIALIAGLIPLIATLELLIIVIDALNFVAALLAPIFAPLAPIFEVLQPILNAFIIALGVAGLLGVLLLLLAPLAPIVLTILALVTAIYLLKLAFETLTPIVAILAIALGNLFADIKDEIDNNADLVVEAFENIINDIIDAVNNALGLTSDTGGGGGGGGGGGVRGAANRTIDKYNEETGSNIPHLYRGGLVRGRPGTDNVPIQATAGEYVMRRDIVRALGTDFFDKLNVSTSADAVSSLMGLSLFMDNLNSFSGQRKNMDGMSRGASNLNTEENANTRDYYLKNFYSAEGFESNLSYNGTNSGLQTRADIPYAIDIGRNTSSSNNGNISREYDERDDGRVVKVELNIDMSGSNFAGEDVAKVVEDKIIANLDNDQGELARRIKEATKKKQ